MLEVAHGRGESISGEGVQRLQHPKQPVVWPLILNEGKQTLNHPEILVCLPPPPPFPNIPGLTLFYPGSQFSRNYPRSAWTLIGHFFIPIPNSWYRVETDRIPDPVQQHRLHRFLTDGPPTTLLTKLPFGWGWQKQQAWPVRWATSHEWTGSGHQQTEVAKYQTFHP